MVSKIEAAERMAEAATKVKTNYPLANFVGHQELYDALSAYRNSTVPTDEELGRVAYEGYYNTEFAAWNERTRIRFIRSAAAVRQWCERSEFTEEERGLVIDCVEGHCNRPIVSSILRKLRAPEFHDGSDRTEVNVGLASAASEDEYRRRLDSWCESDKWLLTEDDRTNLLVTLGLIPQPSPVWEWDEANSMWTLGGKVDGDVFPCAAVKLGLRGCHGFVSMSEREEYEHWMDSFDAIKEWCEQKIREAAE